MSTDRSTHAGQGDATSTLLDRARAQSQALADLRATHVPPLRLPVRDPWSGRAPSRRPLALAFAGLAVVLLASGAWAIVKRIHPSAPAPAERHDALPTTHPPAEPARVASPPPAPASPIAPPVAPATSSAKRAPARRAAPPVHVPPTSEPGATERPLLQPDGELILVPPHAAPGPLFDTEEWKRTRSPARE